MDLAGFSFSSLCGPLKTFLGQFFCVNIGFLRRSSDFFPAWKDAEVEPSMEPFNKWKHMWTHRGSVFDSWAWIPISGLGSSSEIRDVGHQKWPLSGWQTDRIRRKTQKRKFVFPSRETSLLCLTRARQTNCRHDLGERKCLLKDPRAEQLFAQLTIIGVHSTTSLDDAKHSGWISLSRTFNWQKIASREMWTWTARENSIENIFRPEPSQDME